MGWVITGPGYGDPHVPPTVRWRVFCAILAAMSKDLQQLDEDLWVCAAPQKFMGLAMGTRMTVVRLDDGSLVLHSPVPLEPDLKAMVDELGPVRAIIAPNCFHHLYANQWIEAYPEAETWGAPGLRKKRPDLRIDHEIGAETPTWCDQIEVIPVPNTPGWEETVLWHTPTRSIIASDLVQYFPKPLRGVWAWIYQKLAGIGRRPTVSRAIRVAFRNKPGARSMIDDLIARNPKRIVVAHGDLIEDDASNLLREAYAWL